MSEKLLISLQFIYRQELQQLCCIKLNVFDNYLNSCSMRIILVINLLIHQSYDKIIILLIPIDKAKGKFSQ